MFNFFKRKPKGSEQNGIIALDIGTQNIKALFFEIVEDQKEEGRVSVNRHLQIHGHSTVDQQGGTRHPQQLNDLGSIISHCQQAIKLATAKSRLKPTQLIMGISGDFIKGKTITLSEKRDDPKAKINATELQNIIQKLEWKAFSEARKSVSEETGHADVEVKLINSFITQTKIDDQIVKDPIGFQGKTVEVSLFNAFTPINYYDALQSITHELELDLIEIVAEPFALWQCAYSEADQESSMILIDVGCNMTSIAVVESNRLVDTKSFSIGGQSFTKRLALELNISMEEAEKLKKAYTDNKLENKSKSLIQELIQQDIDLWLQAVTLSLSEIKTSHGLPSKIYLSGGGNQLEEIKEALNQTKWHKKLPFARKPQASPLSTESIEKVGRSKKGDKEVGVIPLALAKVALEIGNPNNPLQAILKKVIGIMKM